ncbi:MAG: hypothetical protein MI919_20750, partial [Holophagales bacterium]|nr:hypothetical protein [Holophagales bacterium]
MPFEIKVAFRYLTSSRLQTLLILAGVALGIVVYTFMAALINGLEVSLTEDVIGDIAHVTLEPQEEQPRQLGSEGGFRTLLAVQRTNERRSKLPGWRPLLERIEAMEEVVSLAPQVVGNGFFQRGEKV